MTENRQAKITLTLNGAMLASILGVGGWMGASISDMRGEFVQRELFETKMEALRDSNQRVEVAVTGLRQDMVGLARLEAKVERLETDVIELRSRMDAFAARVR